MAIPVRGGTAALAVPMSPTQARVHVCCVSQHPRRHSDSHTPSLAVQSYRPRNCTGNGQPSVDTRRRPELEEHGVWGCAAARCHVPYSRKRDCRGRGPEPAYDSVGAVPARVSISRQSHKGSSASRRVTLVDLPRLRQCGRLALAEGSPFAVLMQSRPAAPIIGL